MVFRGGVGVGVRCKVMRPGREGWNGVWGVGCGLVAGGKVDMREMRLNFEDIALKKIIKSEMSGNSCI